MQETIVIPQLYVPKPEGFPPKNNIEDTVKYGPERRDFIYWHASRLTREVAGAIRGEWKTISAFAEHLALQVGLKPVSLVTGFFHYNITGRYANLAGLLTPTRAGWYELTPNEITSWERINIVLRELPFDDTAKNVVTLNGLMEGIHAYWKTRKRR